ncbi:MAG: hypothetical protein EOP48_21355 [Sphingobacteriales bacterium]|nr:MAG: hypothetical protein EOP48_21355 [Sphingobacteriales bacterium]
MAKRDKKHKSNKKKKGKGKKISQKQKTNVTVVIDQSKRVKHYAKKPSAKSEESVRYQILPQTIYQQLPPNAYQPQMQPSFTEPKTTSSSQTTDELNTPLRVSFEPGRDLPQSRPFDNLREDDQDLYAYAYPVDRTPIGGPKADQENPQQQARPFVMTNELLSEQIKKLTNKRKQNNAFASKYSSLYGRWRTAAANNRVDLMERVLDDAENNGVPFQIPEQYNSISELQRFVHK